MLTGPGVVFLEGRGNCLGGFSLDNAAVRPVARVSRERKMDSERAAARSTIPGVIAWMGICGIENVFGCAI